MLIQHFIHSSIHSLIITNEYEFHCSLIQHFIHSSIHVFIHSFIHLFIYSFINHNDRDKKNHNPLLLQTRGAVHHPPTHTRRRQSKYPAVRVPSDGYTTVFLIQLFNHSTMQSIAQSINHSINLGSATPPWMRRLSPRRGALSRLPPPPPPSPPSLPLPTHLADVGEKIRSPAQGFVSGSFGPNSLP